MNYDSDIFTDDLNVLAESQEAEKQLEDLPVDERVRIAYGDADLGTRFIVSGGEILEIE